MYLIRPPKIYRWLFKEAIFRLNPSGKTVYLTFDDGPHAEATPFVLNVLKAHDIKATFFVLGKNAEKHPEIVREIREQGHQVGNHGMNHLNGWNTPNSLYAEDVALGKAFSDSNLFRPAYGKLTRAQYKLLAPTEKVVFWDVISGDFDENIASKTVVKNVLNNTRAGSVIVMHDSKKAMNNLKGSINEIIVKLKEKGYQFGVL